MAFLIFARNLRARTWGSGRDLRRFWAIFEGDNAQKWAHDHPAGRPEVFHPLELRFGAHILRDPIWALFTAVLEGDSGENLGAQTDLLRTRRLFIFVSQNPTVSIRPVF